jgi:hypothetical protein
MIMINGVLLEDLPFFFDFLFYWVLIIYISFIEFSYINIKIWKNKLNINIRIYWLLINRFFNLKSWNDKVGIPLKSIISWCTIWTISFMYYSLSNLHELFVCWCLMKSLLHCNSIKLFKTFHTWAMCHHDNTLHYLLLIFSYKL